MTDTQTLRDLAEQCRTACHDIAAASEMGATAHAAADDVAVWYLRTVSAGAANQLDDVLLHRVARWLVQTQHALAHDHHPAVRGGLDQIGRALQELAEV